MIVWMVAAHAAPLSVCTDLGPLGAPDDNEISGRLGPWLASGTPDALTVQTTTERRIYEGPLSGLNPVPPPAALAEDVRKRWVAVDQAPGCGAAGASVRVGAWPPIALGPDQWVTHVGASEAVVRAEQGAAWLVNLSLRKDAAGEIAFSLAQALPEHEVFVIESRQNALLVVSKGLTLPDLPQPVPMADQSSHDWAVLLDVPEAVVNVRAAKRTTVASPEPMLDAVNARRVAAGLPPFTLDADLSTAAQNHCAYLDWAKVELPFDLGHYQTPSSPVFTGKTPAERTPGAAEVVGHDPGFRAAQLVDLWLRMPFHRRDLVVPGNAVAGACASPAGARVVLIKGTAAASPYSWPTDGQAEVRRAFDGDDVPEPVIPLEHPERTLPLGMPISVYLPHPAERVDGFALVLKDGEGARVPGYLTGTGLHPDLLTPRAELHFVPGDPLKPDTTYTWEASWQVWAEPIPEKKRKREALPTPEPGSLSGRFQTRAHDWSQPVGLPDRMAPVLEALNARRTASGRAPLQPHQALNAGAELYIQGGQNALRRVVPVGNLGVVCGNAEDVGTPAFERRLQRFLDPRFEAVGGAVRWDQACLAATEALRRGPAWVPPKP